MGIVMDTDKGADDPKRSSTSVVTDSEQQNAGDSQSGGKGDPPVGLPMYLSLGDKLVIQPLNTLARNAIAHKDPALVKRAVTKALQRRADKEGVYRETGCVVHWKPSAIPFHIEFEISVSNKTCQHLVSIGTIKAKDPDQYAKDLVPVAKTFLNKPPGSHIPHLPFTRLQTLSDNPPDRNSKDKRITDTIQYARLINSQYTSLTEIDIKTAEAAAKMINAGKIFSGLLVFLTSPKPSIEAAMVPTEPPTREDKGFQHTERPISVAPKRPKPLLSTDEIQGLGPIMKHKRVASGPKNDTDEGRVTEKSTLKENSAPEDTSAVGKSLLEEPAAILPSKGGKASKNNQGRKQRLREQSKDVASSTVSAYPTQRPPRKKLARKSITIRDSPEVKSLGAAECNPGRASATRLPALEGSEHEVARNSITITDSPEMKSLGAAECIQGRVSATRLPALDRLEHEEHTPEQALTLEELSQKGFASRKLASGEHEEIKGHTAEEALNRKWIANNIGFLPSDVVHGGNLIATADMPIALSQLAEPIQRYRSGVQGLLWAYTTNEGVDETVDEAGIWLWRKPETYFCTQPLFRTGKYSHPAFAPVVVSHERTENDEPIVRFDGDTVHIVPQEGCWEDVRSHESHPDFLMPWKLAEYQASEAVGYQIWRHDRDFLGCRKPGCDATVSDYHHSTVVCLGCGPKSIVRYCSLQHQLEDIERHWRECGTWTVTLQRVIDHTTAPSKFARMCPTIKQRNGSRNAALHRQMIYCALTNGHYTLFDSASNRSETLCWPKQHPKWPEMDRRIERLLNVAFLDSWNHYILGYLYRLLRELLRSRGEWFGGTERFLKLQLEAEFSNYKVNTNWHHGDAPCECEWSGKILPRYDHLPTCWNYAPMAENYGPVRRQKCVEAAVDNYEERFWILRARRQQHPTQNNWRLRAAGYGYSDMIPGEGCYELGPGWTGWGGARDNICEDRWEHGEKRSTRSA